MAVLLAGFFLRLLGRWYKVSAQQGIKCHQLVSCAVSSRRLYREESGSDKNVIAFTETQVRIVRAWPKAASSEFTLSLVMQRARALREKESQKSRKSPHTAGFFLESVQRAASEGYTDAYGEDMAYMTALKEPDWGGFPDVGQHTRCTPPTTVWALVVAALRSILTSTVNVFLPKYPVSQTSSHSFVGTGVEVSAMVDSCCVIGRPKCNHLLRQESKLAF